MRPKCPICTKRLVHKTQGSSTCFNCFSEMVKNYTWENWVLNRVIPESEQLYNQ